MNINKLLNNLDSNSLELKRIPFINNNIKKCTIDQFNYFLNYSQFKSWKSLLMFFHLKLTPQLNIINNKYGDIIIDLFIKNINANFNLNNSINFNVINNDTSINTKIDINNDLSDFKSIDQNHINFALLKNSIVIGATLFFWEKMFQDIKNDINNIDNTIFPIITQFINCSILLLYINIPTKGIQHTAGSQYVDFSNNNVYAKGLNFIIVCNELLKSIFDIKAFTTTPNDLNDDNKSILSNITNDLFFHHWQWLFSRDMYYKLSKYNNVNNLLSLNYCDLNSLLSNIIL